MHGDYTLDLYLLTDLDPEERNDEEISIELEGSFNGKL